MSDGYERPTTLAAAPLASETWDVASYPLAALPCLVAHLTGRFPTFAEGS
jgi:hypothetical protein